MRNDSDTATSPTSPTSTAGLIDGLERSLARAGSGRAQADGADPQVVDGQRADGEAIPQSLLSRASDQLGDALQILRSTGQPLVSSPMVGYNVADIEAMERRIVNAVELLKAGAR